MPAHAYGFAFARIPGSRHDARAYPDTQKVRCPAKPPVFEPVAVSVMFRHRDVPSQDDKEVHFVFSRCNELFADRTIPL